MANIRAAQPDDILIVEVSLHMIPHVKNIIKDIVYTAISARGKYCAGRGTMLQGIVELTRGSTRMCVYNFFHRYLCSPRRDMVVACY